MNADLTYLRHRLSGFLSCNALEDIMLGSKVYGSRYFGLEGAVLQSVLCFYWLKSSGC